MTNPPRHASHMYFTRTCSCTIKLRRHDLELLALFGADLLPRRAAGAHAGRFGKLVPDRLSGQVIRDQCPAAGLLLPLHAVRCRAFRLRRGRDLDRLAAPGEQFREHLELVRVELLRLAAPGPAPQRLQLMLELQRFRLRRRELLEQLRDDVVTERGIVRQRDRLAMPGWFILNERGLASCDAHDGTIAA